MDIIYASKRRGARGWWVGRNQIDPTFPAIVVVALHSERFRFVSNAVGEKVPQRGRKPGLYRSEPTWQRPLTQPEHLGSQIVGAGPRPRG